MKGDANNNYARTIAINEDCPRHTGTYPTHSTSNTWVLDSKVIKSPRQGMKDCEHTV